jgi:hypothetical protein
MLVFPEGGPSGLSDKANRDGAKRVWIEDPLSFSPGDFVTETLVQQFPISRIKCRLDGVVDVDTASKMNALGVYNLIDSIKVLINGNRNVLSLKGYQLPFIHRKYFRGQPPLEIQPDLTSTGDDKNFEAHFTLPIDLGGYNALLDASREGQLSLEVNFNKDAAISDGTGSVDVKNTKLYVKPIVIEGIPAGEPGGLKNDNGNPPYLANRITTHRYPVNADQDDFSIKNLSGRGYHALTLFTFNNGALSDAVLDRAKVEHVGNVKVDYTRDELKSENYHRFRLNDMSSAWTGIYTIPLVDEGHPEQTLSINDQQQMRELLDVNAGTNAYIDFVPHYIEKNA